MTLFEGWKQVSDHDGPVGADVCLSSGLASRAGIDLLTLHSRPPCASVSAPRQAGRS